MISILAPSRGRPDGLVQMWQSAISTADDPDDLELISYLDDDDPSDYEGLLLEDPRVTLIRGPRCVLSEAWNHAWRRAMGRTLHQAADDIRYRTPGWDTRVLLTIDQFPDGIALVYTRDGYKDEELGTHSFITQAWTDIVGYFVPPYFSCDYNDTWLNEVADIIGRRVYLPELMIEHLHPVVGKAPMDQTHRERIERGERDNVVELYARLQPQRYEDAAKLQAVMR